MKNFDENKIDDYLRGDLSSTEKLAIEKEMQSNPELAADIKRQQAIIEHLKVLEYRRMSALVKDVHQQEHSRSHLKAKPYRFLAVAAAILLMLTAGWWMWDNNTSQDLYAQYYESYDLRFGNRSTSDVLSEAGGYYIDGNFEKAIPLFEEALRAIPDERKASFALGIAQMELEQWEQALPYFQQLIDSKDILYAQNAKWYMALSLYQLGRMEEAQTLLSELSQDKQARFSKKASDFLQKIK